MSAISEKIAQQTLNISNLRNTETFLGREERDLANMYDSDDLGACELFSGNFINFGFWSKSVTETEKAITLEQRTESQKNLYNFVASQLKITPTDVIAEVGCGQGVGAAFVMSKYNPALLIGLDLSRLQIERCKKRNEKTLKLHPNLQYDTGSASKIPFKDEVIDKLYSIEAAQHFPSFEDFTKESFRVLKPAGKIFIATFFGTDKDSHNKTAFLIPTVQKNIDRIRSISNVQLTLSSQGFKDIEIKSIGSNVWHGFDKWVSQGAFKESWTRNWKKAHERGLIDYYVITAHKSNKSDIPI